MASHYKGSVTAQRALSTWVKFYRAGITLNSQLKNSLRRFELTGSQFSVVEALYHIGPLNLTQLSEKLQCTGGNLTTVVDNLENQKLVKRVPSKTDRRQYKIHLTPKGRSHIKKLFPDHVKAIVREMSVLTPSEQDELSRLCKKLGLEIIKQNE